MAAVDAMIKMLLMLQLLEKLHLQQANVVSGLPLK